MGRSRLRPCDPPNPSGRCQCGCGQTTSVATRTITAEGVVKGEHLRFVPGHTATYASQQRAVGNRYRPRVHPVDGPANPGGRCLCGCGGVTARASRTRTKAGIIAGDHLRYLPGHAAWTKVKQRRELERAMRQRLPCFGCFELRPRLAFSDGTQHCVVCLARQQRQLAVVQRLKR